MYRTFSFLFALFFYTSSIAETQHWFTGPLLANPATTTPRGHLLVQPYLFYIVSEGDVILHHPRFTSSASKISDSINNSATLGLTDKLDVQVITNFNHNVHGFQRSNQIGDTSIMFGLQGFTQESHQYRPNFKLIVQEIIPTGRYSDLSPLANGTDASGLGSYQTNVGFNFSYIGELITGHYLQGTLNLNFLYAQPTTVHHLNTFGGRNHTTGKVYPGNLGSLDFALEFSLSQNWAAVFETYMYWRQDTRLVGIISLTEAKNTENQIVMFGKGPLNALTFAPGLEFNFNANLGVLAAYWYSAGGKNSPTFRAPAITVSYLF